MDCVDAEALGAGRDGGAIEPATITGASHYREELAQMSGGGRVVQLPFRDTGRFTVISGGRHDAAPAERPKIWLCSTCQDQTGVATSVVEPVWQGPLRESGRVRLSSGTKRLVCTHCKLRGTLTFVD